MNESFGKKLDPPKIPFCELSPIKGLVKNSNSPLELRFAR
jgi:hypothetical protein